LRRLSGLQFSKIGSQPAKWLGREPAKVRFGQAREDFGKNRRPLLLGDGMARH